MSVPKSKKPVKHKINVDGIERNGVKRSDFRHANAFSRTDVEFLTFGRFLSERAYRVWISIRSFGDGSEDGSCAYFPSIPTIRSRTRYKTDKSIEDGLAELYRFHWLRKKEDFSPWEQKHDSNDYEFTRPVANDKDGAEWIFESPTYEEAAAYRKEIAAVGSRKPGKLKLVRRAAGGGQRDFDYDDDIRF